MFSNAKTTNFIIKVLTEKIDILLLAIPLIFPLIHLTKVYEASV